ncbi:mitochondrial carrier domain-containing protein [Calycina marina]|uniref:Mitochondrial thiamine pyrophosphate carrier 1 n=1 Tax=Calycina marina TaxID=1763456 RepID=A0A9P8CJ74_9HELO|nr:mitochondrial carrier domain-containing protein [Calycina marina]
MPDRESQSSRDARIEELWKKLDPQGKGEIDVNGLRRGLKKIDHPLKHAQDMLEDVVKAIDKNGDNFIQYEEFRTFVDRTEKELFNLFHSIDRDQDNRLDKTELQVAFKRAGMVVPQAKLNQFFAEVDENNDGYITFDEWRNFLLFLPRNSQTPLRAVLSYYASAVSLNAEGDTSIREDTLEGLGTAFQVSSYLNLLFGAIINIAKSPPSISPATINEPDSVEYNQAPFIEGAADNYQYPSTLQPDTLFEDTPAKKSWLMQILPDPGFYLAGGFAGVISRTATAPLDRLKVYLIANVDKGAPIIAAQKGDAAGVVKEAGRPLVIACKELWKAGGMRSLFAGNGLNVLKVMPESAIKFGSYEAAKRALARLEGHDDPQKINPYSKFVAGGIGGMVSHMQCETVSGGLQGNALIRATWAKMRKQGGIRTAYRGLGMGLVGMFPYSAIDLGTFELMKGAVTRHNAKLLGCHEDDAMPGSFTTGCIGAFSGAVGASIVYPINLLRTRLQAQGTVLHPPTYDGVWDVARKTVKNEGMRGLFKGITPNLLKVVPAVSITYVAYENAKKFLHLK